MTPVLRGPRYALAALGVLAFVLAPSASGAAASDRTCAGQPATHVVNVPEGTPFFGTPGDDVIVGSGRNDDIRALGGDDVVCAGGGDDVVVAGSGHDEVYGGPGDDYLLGGRGNDRLFGQEEADTLEGGPGRDVLVGGVGRDVLLGGVGHDTLYGREGDDKLFGEGGRDRLYGEVGDDELQGGSDADRLWGGDGDDFLWGDGGDDVLTGGPGDDLLQGGAGADALWGQEDFDELWGGECALGSPMKCRAVPTGRPSTGIAADPADLYRGGPGVDACNKSPVVPETCETYRGSRGPGGLKTTSQEWWGQIGQAFDERASVLVEAGKVEVADALLAEVEHAKQIVACESLGDPFQMTPSPSAGYPTATVDGLFQHKSIYWAGRATGAGYPGASVFDPLANARVAAWMVAADIAAGRDPWAHWACDEVLKNLGKWE